MKALALFKNFSSKFPRVSWPKGAEHSIFLDPDVYFEGSATLYPGVIIEGTTQVGDGCIFEPNCYIKASRIGKHCILAGRIEQSTVGHFSHIHSNCRFIKSTCGEYGDLKGEIENCKLGDRVLTRANCIMHDSSCEDDCCFGAELRRTHAGKNVKAVHQNSYLGDTIVHDGVNFAAGSITANYDGTPEKKKTEIGENSFIGISNYLVAKHPMLRIGKNVATAAGITVREDVPDDTFMGPDGKHRPNKLHKVGKHWVREDKN